MKNLRAASKIGLLIDNFKIVSKIGLQIANLKNTLWISWKAAELRTGFITTKAAVINAWLIIGGFAGIT